jgi:hypothetical protein
LPNLGILGFRTQWFSGKYKTFIPRIGLKSFLTLAYWYTKIFPPW